VTLLSSEQCLAEPVIINSLGNERVMLGNDLTFLRLTITSENAHPTTVHDKSQSRGRLESGRVVSSGRDYRSDTGFFHRGGRFFSPPIGTSLGEEVRYKSELQQARQ